MGNPALVEFHDGDILWSFAIFAAKIGAEFIEAPAEILNVVFDF
jgi:hypothetical protein